MDERVTDTPVGGCKSVLLCGSEWLPAHIARLLPEVQVQQVWNRDSLIDCIHRQWFDLVIADVVPGGEGGDLLDALHSIDPQLRVMLISSEGLKLDAITALKGNAFGYFARPYLQAIFDQLMLDAMNDTDWRSGIEVRSATEDWVAVSVRCDVCSADRVAQFMSEIVDFTGKSREQFGFAFREILMNGIEYGGRFDRSKRIEITYVKGEHLVLLSVRDPGPGFSMANLGHASIGNPPEDPLRHLAVRESQGLRPGGYGLMLSRKLVDEMIFNEQGNEVMLVKYLDQHHG